MQLGGPQQSADLNSKPGRDGTAEFRLFRVQHGIRAWDANHPTQGWKDASSYWRVLGHLGRLRLGRHPGSLHMAAQSCARLRLQRRCSESAERSMSGRGSGAAITTSRSGGYVTIKTSSSRYAYSLSQWVRWGGVRGTIQYYGPNGWTNLKYAYQDASGYFTYRVYASHGPLLPGRVPRHLQHLGLDQRIVVSLGFATQTRVNSGICGEQVTTAPTGSPNRCASRTPGPDRPALPPA